VRVSWLAGLAVGVIANLLLAADMPVIPVGLDAYRQWDKWPYQRIGARAYMRSTYDRRGGNEGADASHFLYQEADDFNVTLDVEGPGVLYFARYNHWHGSPWHYEVDGRPHIVQETTTSNPTKPRAGSVFMPEELFAHPLTWTWSVTKGADLMWVPIPFRQRFRMAYSRTHYGTGYYIYHQYLPDARLSQPIKAWDGKTPPDAAVLELLGRTGTDIAPWDIPTISGRVQLPGGGSAIVAEIAGQGPRMIRALKLLLPRDKAVSLGRTRLRITWDGRKQSSVDAPLSLFYGAGTLHNRDNREYLVKALPCYIRYDDSSVHLGCFFPMPFFQSARIELAEAPAGAVGAEIVYEVRHQPYADPPNHVGYFHATYRDHAQPELGRDLVFLDTHGLEGNDVWAGSFVGTSFIFSHKAILNTLEGDPRFFFDDAGSPQCYGTGTEEWGGGGDYWGGQNMTIPLAGHPCGVRMAQEAQREEDLIQSAYRFLLADLMPFGRRVVIRFEHGGVNESEEHYESVVYWYGLPAAALVLTDELVIGETASEQAHGYHSPAASSPAAITSRWDGWGPETAALHGGQIEVIPTETKLERHTTGTSEFTLKLRADNRGVLLRRTLDYSFPNQRAEVFIAEASGGPAGAELQWESAGAWRLAGSNTCVYSNPTGELGATEHNIQTSNRRFRDEEFLVARRLTEGRSVIRVRVRFTPVDIPLFLGQSLVEQAWSEIAYRAYCYVLPEFNP